MSEIFIASRRKKIDNIKTLHPNSEIIDVTSKGSNPWIKFSPFYPHGNIPVPYLTGYTSFSVEGIWQGLKVFKSQDIDPNKFLNNNMKGLKRTVRRFGQVLGHRYKNNEHSLLTYLEARMQIYIPSYQYILHNFLQKELNKMRGILEQKNIVLLDYETNSDIKNLKKPLSHASLIAKHLREAT